VGIGPTHGGLDDFVQIWHQNGAFDQKSSPDGRLCVV